MRNYKTSFVTIIFSCLFLSCSSNKIFKENPFGVLLSKSLTSSAVDLGVVYFRPASAIFLDSWDGSCAGCDIALNYGLKLVLTVRNNRGQDGATTSPEDLSVYREKIRDVLEKYPPALLVVENEENSTLFYVGTPEEYGQQLKNACEVAHEKGILCTNGGLVSTLVALLVYYHYLDAGEVEKAEDFADRAFTPEQRDRLDSPEAMEQVSKGRSLLDAYQSAGVDYVNFHWYIADTKALVEAVDFLRNETGHAVITNEVGQWNDDPSQTTAVLSKLRDLSIPIAVWFGIDGPKARGLVNPDGSLRPTGEAFKKFIEENFN